MKIKYSEKAMIFVLLVPRRNQLRDQMLVPLQLLTHKRKQVHPVLLQNGPSHRFLSQLIVEVMRQSFSSVESLLGRVDHDLGKEVQKERVSFGENLHQH